MDLQLSQRMSARFPKCPRQLTFPLATRASFCCFIPSPTLVITRFLTLGQHDYVKYGTYEGLICVSQITDEVWHFSFIQWLPGFARLRREYLPVSFVRFPVLLLLICVPSSYNLDSCSLEVIRITGIFPVFFPAFALFK